MHELNAILTIAFRDVIKFLRDRTRILSTFVFPLIFIGVLGGGLQASLGDKVGYNFLAFIFVGVFAQTLFQSTASGVIWLIEDRTNDFSQELFVSPISRYSIIFGKILGESSVAMIQGAGIIVFGLIIGIALTLQQIMFLIPVGLVSCLLGGAFGVLVLSNLKSSRTASQIFPFIIFPQFFLAGVFNPIKDLPGYLLILSKITPMTYAVDLVRGVYYFGQPEYTELVLASPLVNLAIIAVLFSVFLVLGTYLFVRHERNR